LPNKKSYVLRTENHEICCIWLHPKAGVVFSVALGLPFGAAAKELGEKLVGLVSW